MGKLIRSDGNISNSFSLRFMFHIVLYEPEIAGNTGNVGRTCVALGAKLWLVRPMGFQIEDRHLRRAGMDYWTHLDWEAVENWEELLRRLGDCRLWFFTKTARAIYTDVDYSPRAMCWFSAANRGACRRRFWKRTPTAACGFPSTKTPAA